MLITEQQFISEASDAVHLIAQNFTVAILTCDEKQRPHFIGSGVFIEKNENKYLITAGHVLNHMQDGIYVGKNGLFALEGKAVRREPKNLLDVAYWRVPKEFLEKTSIPVVSEDKLIGRREFINAFRHVSGFPKSKNKFGKAVNIGARKIDGYCFGFSAPEIMVEFDKYKKDRRLHTALLYAGARNSKTEKVNPPSLDGMSGGPLWYAKDIFSVSELYLAGILIERHKVGDAIFCTKIGPILDFIDQTEKTSPGRGMHCNTR